MANSTANLTRRLICSGRVRTGALNDSASDVVGCRAVLTSTNPLQWTITFNNPLPIPGDFSLLEIHQWIDTGDGSAAALSSTIVPSNITNNGVILNWYDKNGAAVASSLSGGFFEVYVRPNV